MIYSHVGPITGIEGDENTVFQGDNTAQIMIALKENLQLHQKWLLKPLII